MAKFLFSTKKYYKIGEVAEILSVNPSLLRFWESQIAALKPKKTKTGQRLYTEEDLTLLKVIKKELKEKGMTIEGLNKKLRKTGTVPSEILDKNILFDIKKELEDILEILKEGK